MISIFLFICLGSIFFTLINGLLNTRLNCDYNGKVCRGALKVKCPKGYKCVDDPRRNCDPNWFPDCAGMCIKPGCPILL